MKTSCGCSEQWKFCKNSIQSCNIEDESKLKGRSMSKGNCSLFQPFVMKNYFNSSSTYTIFSFGAQVNPSNDGKTVENVYVGLNWTAVAERGNSAGSCVYEKTNPDPLSNSSGDPLLSYIDFEYLNCYMTELMDEPVKGTQKYSVLVHYYLADNPNFYMITSYSIVDNDFSYYPSNNTEYTNGTKIQFNYMYVFIVSLSLLIFKSELRPSN